LEQVQQQFLAAVWRDSVGFAGLKMIRRVVGIAHVEDLESIRDKDLRARCEKACLVFARRLAVQGLGDVNELNEWAREVYEREPTSGEEWVV